MAIKKSDLEQGWKTEVDRLEEIISCQLKNYYQGQRIRLSENLFTFGPIRDELVRRFELAGWKISFKYEQGSGDSCGVDFE